MALLYTHLSTYCVPGITSTSATATIQNKTDQNNPARWSVFSLRQRNSIMQMYCCYFDREENRVRSQRVTRLLSSLGYLDSPHVLAGVGFCPEMGLSGYRSQALTLLLRRAKLALLGTGPRAMETGKSHDLSVPACSLPSTPTP